MVKCKGCNANGPHVKPINKCSQCYGEVHFNELLHYACHHYGTSAKDNIRRVIQEKFSHDDIVGAKKLLSDIGVQVEMSDGRRDGPNRTAVEADMYDLMDALEKLDQLKDFQPKFAALDWEKVPKISPEEACNTASIAARLSTVEGLLKLLQTESKNHAENIGTLFDSVTKNNSFASVVGRAPVANGPPGGNRTPVQVTPSGTDHGQPARRQATGNNSKPQSPLLAAGEGANQKGQPQIHTGNRSNGKPQRKKAVIGNKTDERLQSGSGKAHIIVQYVKRHFTNDNIKSYLRDENVEVHSVETVSHEAALTKSFKVEINFNDKAKVVSEDFWPKGIGCRPWFPKRSGLQNLGATAAGSNSVV